MEIVKAGEEVYNMHIGLRSLNAQRAFYDIARTMLECDTTSGYTHIDFPLYIDDLNKGYYVRSDYPKVLIPVLAALADMLTEYTYLPMAALHTIIIDAAMTGTLTSPEVSLRSEVGTEVTTALRSHKAFDLMMKYRVLANIH